MAQQTKTPSSPDADRYRRWVGAWSDAVRSASTAVGLAELRSTWFIELSPRAAVLLGRSPDTRGGFDVLTMFERPDDAAIAARLVSEGFFDGTQARRRLLRLDGAVIDVMSHSRAIRSSIGPDLCLWVASNTGTGSSQPAITNELLAETPARPASPALDRGRVNFGIVDDRWRVTDAEPAVGDLLERRPDDLVGTTMVEFTHPDDVGAMLLAVAATTTDPNALACLRVQRRDGTWLAVEVVVAMVEGDEDPRFEFALTPSRTSERSQYEDRVDQLERHLRRISAEVEAAGVIGTVVGSVDLMALPALRELSSRQWEVVTRLVRGERVQTIASEMHLSPSTVRNHLAAIYRKVGVHSQHELLSVLRAHEPSTSA